MSVRIPVGSKYPTDTVKNGGDQAPTRLGIRAITFDVGGTLIEPWPSVGHIYAEVAARHGYPNLVPAVLNRRFAEAWWANPNFAHTRAAWETLVDATFAGLTKYPPSRTFFSELYDRFSEVSAWRVFDDVHPVLGKLAERGLKLGIISNWDDRLEPLLSRLKLAHWFEVVVISYQVGCAKPGRQIFEQAAAALQLSAAAILHVGDSPAHDVQGASAAGFNAVLLQRNLKRSSPSVIRSLVELY